MGSKHSIVLVTHGNKEILNHEIDNECSMSVSQTLIQYKRISLVQGWANFLAQGPHLVFKTDRWAGPLVDEDHNV